MTIFLTDQYQFRTDAEQTVAEEHLKALKRDLEYLILGDVVLKTEIHYDPNCRSTVIEEDVDFVETYVELFIEEFNVAMSPWVLRIVLNADLFHVKELQIDDINNKICSHFSGQVNVIASNQNAGIPLAIYSYKCHSSSNRRFHR